MSIPSPYGAPPVPFNGTEATAHCNEVLHPIFEANSKVNGQFPYVLFDEPGCKGRRYPEVGEFPLWDQHMTADHLHGIREIKSLYVAPHAVLEIWNGAKDGYQSISGPQVWTNTDAQMMYWFPYDGSPCPGLPGESCGTPVVWSLDTADSKIRSIRLHRMVSWPGLLSNFASNKNTITFNGTTYDMDNDALFTEICQDGQNAKLCFCHNEWLELQDAHGLEVAKQSFVNLTQNNCNTLTQFVPTEAPVGAGTAQECNSMFYAQLANGTFPTMSQGGPATVICAQTSYANVQNPVVPPPATSVNPRLLRGVPILQVTLAPESQQTPAYAWWILGALLIVGVLMLVFYFVYRSIRRHRSKSVKISRLKASAPYQSAQSMSKYHTMSSTPTARPRMR